MKSGGHCTNGSDIWLTLNSLPNHVQGHMANHANVCDPILILAHMAVSLYIVYILRERG